MDPVGLSVFNLLDWFTHWLSLERCPHLTI